MADESRQRGMLILCATPLGNLKDITLRVIETLKEADLIACEDTRHSLGLLNHYGIKVPLTSYHEHNKYKKADSLIELLREGKNIALITDAGTPAISDPGEVLVQRCHSEGICVTSLPGPCALITALTLSGLSARRFVFEGFLPPRGRERKAVLESLGSESRTVILYEAPHHLIATLKDLYEALGERRITLCRELTKQFEDVYPTTLSGALELYGQKEPRGEYVLVLEGRDAGELRNEEIEAWQQLTAREHVLLYEEKGLSQKEAMKAAARDRGVSKRDIYNELLADTKNY